MRARVGIEPSSEPKIRSWSEKSMARVDSRDCANATAAASFAGSMPEFGRRLFAQAPAGGK